ncbi:unnamed protein product [Phaeothamnion confervicola]
MQHKEIRILPSWSPLPTLCPAPTTAARRLLSGCGCSAKAPTPGFHAGDLNNGMNKEAFGKGTYMEKETAIAQSQFLAKALFNRGMYEDALRAAALQLQQSDAHFGRAHPATASALNNVALMHKMRGDLAKSIDAYSDALAAYRAALGTEDHPSFATALSNLGLVYRALADAAGTPKVHRVAYHEQARQHFARALEIRGETLAAGHPDVEMARNNAAVEEGAAAGDKTSAEAGLRRSVARLEDAVGHLGSCLTDRLETGRRKAEGKRVAEENEGENCFAMTYFPFSTSF